jgi:hypothetical protein
MNTVACLRAAIAALAIAGATLAHAQQPAGPYRYTMPPGWQRSVADGMESFVPIAEPADTVQIVLLPAKPLQGALQPAFDAERAALEAGWGLSAPMAAAPQAGRVGELSYSAHYASYESAGGPRYMAFMGLGQNARLAMLVFVASTPEAFTRWAPQAAALLQSLRIAQ